MEKVKKPELPEYAAARSFPHQGHGHNPLNPLAL